MFSLLLFFCTAFPCACSTVFLPYFATRWLRNAEQRPLQSVCGGGGGSGEKAREAENCKSRRNQRSEQNSNAVVPANFGMHCEPRPDNFSWWSSVCVVCRLGCVCATCVHIPSHIFHGQRSKPESSSLPFGSTCPATCQKWCEVRSAEHRCQHGCVWWGEGGSPCTLGGCSGVRRPRSCETYTFTWMTLGKSLPFSHS